MAKLTQLWIMGRKSGLGNLQKLSFLKAWK
jgi:hypothetical protein